MLNVRDGEVPGLGVRVTVEVSGGLGVVVTGGAGATVVALSKRVRMEAVRYDSPPESSEIFFNG